MTAIKYKKVAEVCEIIMGQSPSSDTYNDRKEGLPFFQGKADFGKLHPTPKTYCSAPLKVANENDILMSVRAPVGDVNIANTKCCIGRGLAAIRANNDMINYKYLFYALNYKKNEIESMGTGSTFKAISKKDIESIQIPVFDIENQVKIVKALDKAQELIDKRKAQIEALDQLTQSVFLEMFGDLIKNTNQYKKEKLANLCIKITDGTHHSPPTVKEGIPYITAKHLNKGGLDFFKDPTYVSLEDHQKIYERCNPEKGDVLYIKDGATTGIAAINHYDFEFSMLSSLALIKVDFNKLNNYYLTHFLNNERVFRKITSGMNGGAIKRLTLKKINNIEVVVPPIELQNQFAEIIKKIEIQKELLQKSLEELENNFSSLMQQAFKGELFND
ncbi:restriction endonuclease subunit S [Geobacillus stearothermophilus]|nr:restriction endonuclease subunit S [Geobacillus stearothermophilus]